MITWKGWSDRCSEASQEAYDRAKAIDPGAWSLNGTERRRETAVIQAERELAITGAVLRTEGCPLELPT